MQEQLEQQKSKSGGLSTNETHYLAENQEIDGLQQLLDNISESVEDRRGSVATRFSQKLDSKPKLKVPQSNEISSIRTDQHEAKNDVPFIPSLDLQAESNLSVIAGFDSRLRYLETALGIDALPLPTQDQFLAKPLLPTLDTLDKQINALATSNVISLDKIKSRVRELGQEAENLERNKSQAKRAMDVLGQSNIRSGTVTRNGETAGFILDDTELMSKVNALYGTLNTIESLAPLLPTVLDRLHSLKDLHIEAATAGQNLNRLESKQEDMSQELQSWRDGLARVEKAMHQGQETIKGNTEVIEGWVKDLEGRMKNFG